MLTDFVPHRPASRKHHARIIMPFSSRQKPKEDQIWHSAPDGRAALALGCPKIGLDCPAAVVKPAAGLSIRTKPRDKERDSI